MAKLDITRPEVIIFLNEAFEKEKRLRSYWVSKNTEKILKAATLTREFTNYHEQDVIKHSMIGGMAAITRDHVVAGRNRKKVPIRDAKSIPGIESIRHKNSLINLGEGDAKEDPRLVRPDTDLSPDPIMRPIDPKTKKILFKPRPVFGREKYLAERYKLMPEKRYYFPECEYWDHGWRMYDGKQPARSTFGRNWALQKTLRVRSGATPDPWHYKAATQGDFSKCAPD